MRRRSGSVAQASPAQSPTSPVVGRAGRSPSVSGASRGRAMSISLEQTVPDALGSLMFSPRADKLEENFVIEHQSEVKGAVLVAGAGAGGLSQFYQAEFKGQKVLQKVIRYRNIDDKVLAAFEKEVAVLSTLSHANIVRFIGAKATPPDLFMLLEWMERGPLSGLLLNDLSSEISWQQRVSWAVDVAKGIDYLHSLKPKIIHRDLRCENVLVNSDNVAKLSEFGLSRRKRFAMKASPRNSHEEGAAVSAVAAAAHSSDKGKEDHSPHHDKYAFVSEGGPAFTAPELLKGSAYSEKVDMYNFGVLSWQLMTRQLPHHGVNSIELADAIVTKSLRPKIPDFVPEDMRSLICDSWHQDETARPSSDQIVARLQVIAAAKLEPELPTEDVDSVTSEGSDVKKDHGEKVFNEFL